MSDSASLTRPFGLLTSPHRTQPRVIKPDPSVRPVGSRSTLLVELQDPPDPLVGCADMRDYGSWPAITTRGCRRIGAGWGLRLQKLYKHATASEGNARIDAMIKLARSDERIGVRREDIDANRFLFNTAGRTFNLATGEDYPPCRADLLTKQAGTVAAQRARCPTWIAFLTKIMGGDTDPVGAAEMVAYLQRVLGYCLSGEQREQCFWILHGESGSNGKSKFMDLVRHVLGDYAQHPRAQTFMLEKNGGGIPNEVAALAGLRLVTASEPPAGAPLNEALIKEMTGEGEIRARFLYSEGFGFAPTFKLLLACNKLPKITGTGGGIWRRPRLIPFNVEITDAEKDRDLGEKLKAEAPGIPRWMLDGWREYKRIGLADPDRVFYARDDYRSGTEPMVAFLAECCDVGNDYGPTPVSALFTAYERWAGDDARTSAWFGGELTRKKIQPDPRHGAGRRRLGIVLRVRQ